MRYTLSQAAEATGKNKATIQRAIKSGKISAQKGDSGAYAIDPAELHRVFPPKSTQQQERNGSQRYATPNETSESSHLRELYELKIELATALTKNAALEDHSATLNSTIDYLRERLDRADARIAGLLEDRRPPRTEAPSPDTAPSPPSKKTWKIFGFTLSR